MESLIFTNAMPPKGESAQTYLPPEIKRKLEEWAAAEKRSISFLVAQILTDAIATKEAQSQRLTSGTRGEGKGRGTKGGKNDC